MTPRFLDPIRTEDQGDGRARLLDAFRVDSAVLRGRLVVPAGFVTDFASVPRLPLVYWLFGNRARGPAVVHDFLYQTHLCADKTTADAVFRELMRVEGDTGPVRVFMWLGVHVAGQAAWASGPERFLVLGNVSGAAAFIPGDDQRAGAAAMQER
jgi:hypothetical protein